MKILQDFKQRLLTFSTSLLNATKLYLLIIFLFVYHAVMDIDLKCPCEPGYHHACWSYMALPFFILMFIVLLLDKQFQTVLRYGTLYCCSNSYKERCKEFRKSPCCHPMTCDVLQVIMNALSTSMLWVAAVLLDGDWYVCCENNFSKENSTIPCKKSDNLTLVERVSISDLKSWSVLGGLVCILSIALLRIFGSCICCKSCRGEQYRTFFNTVIMEEADTQIEKMLEDRAKHIVSQKVNNTSNWDGLFELSGDLMNDFRLNQCENLRQYISEHTHLHINSQLEECAKTYLKNTSL